MYEVISFSSLKGRSQQLPFVDLQVIFSLQIALIITNSILFSIACDFNCILFSIAYD